MFYTTSQNYLFSIEEKNTPSLQGIFYYASQKSIFFFSLFHKINQYHSRFQLCSVLHIIANIYNFLFFLCVFPF